jgi:transcription initiation factor IIE alpha subunit
MHVFECNICGETLSAATAEELLSRLRSHVEERHPAEGFDEAHARATIAAESYHATDS